MARRNPTGRHSILASICLAALILPLSFSGGAVAMPAIGRDLGGSAIALSWITNAFMLSFGSFLMAAGALADEFGRKTVFATGVAAFTVVSVVIGFAPTIVWLDVLRGVQGLAAAAALAGGSAALAQEFDGAARMRAFSLLGTSFGVGLAFGPVLAGVLIDHYGWRAVFLSSAVVGALALLFGIPRLQESRDPDAAGLDWPGTLTFTGALALFTWGVLLAPTSGWTNGRVLALLAGAVACLALFVLVECRAHRPMLDLSLFRYPRFIGVQVLPIATCYCFVVLLVLLPLRFIGIESRSEIATGLAMIALSAPMLFMPSVAAWLAHGIAEHGRSARTVSPGRLCGIGLLVAAGGLFWLSCVGVSNPPPDIVAPMLVIGIGTGLPWGLMDGLSVSVVPKERAGMATGIFSTTRVAGEGLALAIVTALLTTLIQTRLPADASTHMAAQSLAIGNLQQAAQHAPDIAPQSLAQAYDDAFRWLLYVLIAITLVSAAVAFWLLDAVGTATPVREHGSDPETDEAADAIGSGNSHFEPIRPSPLPDRRSVR